MGRGRAGAGQGQVGGAWAVAVEVLRAWARNKLMARLMGRGSAAARLRDMGRGSAGENLRGTGSGSAGVRLRGMGRSSLGARLRGMGSTLSQTLRKCLLCTGALIKQCVIMKMK